MSRRAPPILCLVRPFLALFAALLELSSTESPSQEAPRNLSPQSHEHMNALAFPHDRMQQHCHTEKKKGDIFNTKTQVEISHIWVFIQYHNLCNRLSTINSTLGNLPLGDQ